MSGIADRVMLKIQDLEVGKYYKWQVNAERMMSPDWILEVEEKTKKEIVVRWLQRGIGARPFAITRWALDYGPIQFSVFHEISKEDMVWKRISE
jgi:hypothetical protein